MLKRFMSVRRVPKFTVVRQILRTRNSYFLFFPIYSKFFFLNSGKQVKMSKHFTIAKNGPVVPTGVNQKSFVSVKIAPGDTHKFKDTNVAKMTAGKIRLRNEEEKSFTSDNSEYAEKNDIVEITGSVIGHNEHKEEHASCRVFTKTK